MWSMWEIGEVQTALDASKISHGCSRQKVLKFQSSVLGSIVSIRLYVSSFFFFKFYDFSYITDAGKNNRNSHPLLVGMQNVSTHVEDSLAVSYNKTKHTLIIYSSSHALWYLSKWLENLCPQRNLHMML